MKRTLKLVFGLLIATCALLAGATTSSRSLASPAQPLIVTCPTHLVAPYGGMDGWSTVNVQANFARAVLTPTKIMTCQYRFGSGAIFFGIQKPCPPKLPGIPTRNGFRVIPG